MKKDTDNVNCPLCGNPFSPAKNTLCPSCPLGAACNLICCPNCGYQWPETSKTVDFFKTLFSKKERKE